MTARTVGVLLAAATLLAPAPGHTGNEPVALGGVGLGVASAAAQTPARTAEPSGDAVERLVFPARPGVCGTGDAIIIRDADGSTSYIHTGRGGRDWSDWSDRDPPCEAGAVVVELGGRPGALESVSVRVVDGSDHTTGRITGQAAVDRLLAEARRSTEGRTARRLVLAASLAGDAVAWPGLLALARDRALPEGTRKTALHWLARSAGEKAAAELGGIVRDRTESDEIREAAVFAVSQLPADQAVPLLMELARTSDEPRVRSRALFWLATIDDPRVIALFEEILTAPGPSR